MTRRVPWTELLITDGSSDFDRIARISLAALEAGIGALLLREKALSSAARQRWVERLRPSVHERGAVLIVSEDLAAARLADGVHLSFRSPPVSRVRQELGEEAWVGSSVHDEAELERAVDGGADYVTFGPVHAPSSKDSPFSPRGVARTARASSRCARPLFALGGIGIAEAAELRAAGVRRVAFIGAVFDAREPAEAARSLHLSPGESASTEEMR